MSSNRSAPLITLLSDLGAADTYVGVMKAVILGICPEARIVDLCHDVPPQDVQQAAFLLDTAWGYCPEGTVHVIVVDPGVGSERRVLAVEGHGQQFVAPDNGVLTYVLASARDHRAFAVARREYFLPEVSQTFHGRDVLAPVAARLALGLPTEAVGPQITGPLERFPISRPVVSETGLVAHVVHVDRFGNLVTDLSEEDLLTWKREIGADNVIIRVGDSVIEEIRVAYAGANPGDLLALFGSSRRLEIALNLGSAAECLGVGIGAIVMIEGRV
ncbi:MAG TPA: SAM-dependent chlorinase/fluorinase [Armatimonadota bacterium]|nr:SAM-dependent chlorinase/fluorinase [Armatimonadota bacterium]